MLFEKKVMAAGAPLYTVVIYHFKYRMHFPRNLSEVLVSLTIDWASRLAQFSHVYDFTTKNNKERVLRFLQKNNFDP